MHTLTRKTVLAGRYVLDEQIGTGNGTSVWRATDSVLDRAVAVRVLHPQAAQAGAAERFERAARAAAGLTHPNIVAVYDSGHQDDTPYLVMELLEGEALDRKVARDGPMRAADAVHTASCVLAALTAAQAAGAGHPAISTGQVFVGPGSQVRISAVGTGEQSPDGDRDADADGEVAIVHAVGEILYFALTGKSPPTAGPASPRAIRARVPRAVDVVVTRALSADAREQFGSASSLSSTLSRLRLEPGSAAGDSKGLGGNEDTSASGSIFRSWMLIPLVMIAVAVAVIAAGFALGRLEIGGPLLVEAKSEPVAPSPARAKTTDATADPKPISVESVSAWDPFGDGHENDANTSLAVDGSNATFWKTEDYYSGHLGKPGVGLMLDLGSRQTVSEVRLVTLDPGFRFDIRVGDDPDALAHGTSEGGPFEAAHKVTRENLSPATGRYVLVWITSIEPLPDGTHGASIADIELAGPPDNG